MELLNPQPEPPPSKLKKRLLIALVAVGVFSGYLYYLLRYQREKNTAAQFFTVLASGDSQQAYRLWKPHPTYTYEDFLEDWGPKGYYGPVKSFRIGRASRLKGASGVIVLVEVSAADPFPAGNAARIKELRIWVERANQSLSFGPP